MNIPLSWIEELTGVKTTDREYANKMTMLGQKVERYYSEIDGAALGDTVFEFEITSNRPDCLSVIGLARETAAAYGLPFAAPEPAYTEGSGRAEDYLSVEVQTDKCLRYSAAVVKNVRVAPSPQWLSERLIKCGLRPINNIVDITNYVMLEYGQPMHAFDLKHVKDNKIIIRQAARGESIVTLDDVERTLDDTDMIIADAEKPTAVAGVMGGQFSGIYEDTATVAFESACFDAMSVRFTAKKLGLRTDSSSRFEKGLDPNNAYPALLRALELVKQLEAGEPAGEIIDVYRAPKMPAVLSLDPGAVNALLGTSLTADYMHEALTSLGFTVDEDLTVTAPTFRNDVECTADLAEEIARLYGYDNIPSTILRGAVSARPSERARFERSLKELCVSSGFFETLTLSFMSEKSLERVLDPEDGAERNAVRISNPFGEETSLMRTTLLPSLMDALARNYNARAETAALFELSAVYLPRADETQLPDEPKKLVAAGYGGVDYFRLKGLIERMASLAGVGDLVFEPVTTSPAYHPGRSARVSAAGRVFAVLGELHPALAENYGIKARCSAAEIDVNTLFELRGPTVRYKPLPRYPAITRDLAVVADAAMLSAEIEAVIKRAGGSLIESLGAFDVYTGPGVAEGKKSVAYNLTLRDEDRTLTDAEADGVVADILIALGGIGVSLR